MRWERDLREASAARNVASLAAALSTGAEGR
jgi:hypothetical protein